MMLRQARITTTDPGAVLQMLQQQEVAYSVQLSDALRQLQEVQKSYERSEGKQKKSAGEQLTELESRVVTAQQRLANVRDQVAQLKRDGVTSTTGIGGSAGVTVAPSRDGIFGFSAAEFGGALTLLFAFPIVLGLSRWIWRRTAPRAVPGNVLEGNPQFARLELAVEAIAIEVERIGEAQRFSAKLLAERPVEAKAEQASPPLRSRRPVITPLP